MRRMAAAAIAAALTVGTAAHAAEPFAGQTVYMSSSTDPGGGFDVYVRLLARHIGRHIAGNPTVVPQNRPGGGGLVLANYLYNAAPKDGTTIGLIPAYVLLEERFKNPQAKFDPTKLNWLGSGNNEVSICAFWHTAGLTSTEHFMTTPLVVGGTGPGADTDNFPLTLNNVLGTKLKLITGYPGGNDINIAMERGEVNCIGGTTWSSVKATMRPMLEARKINLLVQWGTRADPEISDYARRKVPLIHDLGQDRLDRFVLQFIGSGAAFGRPLLAAPGVPPERVAILRRAFDRTMADPAFRTEAAKLNMEIKPLGGDALQTMATEIAASPPQGLARARELIGSAQ